MRELTEAEQRKKKCGLCLSPFCRKHAKNRNYCYACARRIWAENNPIKYVYANLKGNARRRKKDFRLTFTEFLFFVNQNDFMNHRGKEKLSLSVDRKRNWEGYYFDNIEAVTLSYNSRKADYADYPGHPSASDTPVPF